MREDIVLYKEHYFPSYIIFVYPFSICVEMLFYIWQRGRILLKVKRSIYDVTHAVVNIVFWYEFEVLERIYLYVSYDFLLLDPLLENIILCVLSECCISFGIYFDHWTPYAETFILKDYISLPKQFGGTDETLFEYPDFIL